MGSFQSWVNTFGAYAGPLLILWQLIKQTREGLAASRRAELAASEAARHVKIVADDQAKLTANIAELTVNTNSIKDELVKTTGELGRLTGREEMRAETEMRAATEMAKKDPA